MLPIFLSHAATGWLALLGLAVPLAIYLWNRRPGRVVRVGSVRWLEAAANQRLRSLKPEQLLLLLLRTAMLSLLALALAEPAQHLPAPPRHGQVLLAPGVTAAALAPVRDELDSLRRRGYELRQLAERRPLSAPVGWAAIGLGDTTQTPARLAVDSIFAPAPNLWHTVQVAADSLPGRPVVVVAPLSVASFQGTRPALPATVRWLPLPPSDSSRWPVAAWQPHPDSLVLLLATGSESAIGYQKVRLRRPAVGQNLPGRWGRSEIRLASQNELVVTENGRRRPLPLLTRAPRWQLSYDAAHAASARVLTAALRALAPVLPLRPRLVSGPALPVAPDSLDWLFWLRDTSLPARWSNAPGLQTWQEAPTTAKGPATWFQPVGSHSALAIARLDTVSPAGATTRWPTAAGRPLLSWQTPGRYRLHSRLDAAWSSLADTPELPALLLPILIAPTSPTFQPDSRPIALAQLRGPMAAEVEVAAAAAGPTRPLAPWLVLGAGLLFGLERLLAARRPGRPTSTANPLSS